MADGRDEFFDLEALARREQEMAAVAVRFSASLDPNRTSVGKDKTEAVSATVDGAGRVRTISVDEFWREKIEPSGLGRAIVSAVQNGQLQQVAAWSASVMESSPIAASATDPDRFSHDVNFPRLSTEQRLEALGEAVSLLESLPERLNAFDRQVAELSERTVEGLSPNHRINIRSEGGFLAEVHMDATWLEATDHVEISRQISGAFQSLYARTPDAVADVLASDTTISELRTVGRDVNALLGFLGVIPR